jgi:hypothetical protein
LRHRWISRAVLPSAMRRATSARVSAWQAMRDSTMVCNARSGLPITAAVRGDDARPCPTTPRSALPRRAWQRRPPSAAGPHATRRPSSRAAQTTPMPGSASSHGARRRTSVSSSAWSSSASPRKGQRALCGAAQRGDRGAIFDRLGWVAWASERSEGSSWSVASARSCWRRRSGALTTSALQVVDRARAGPALRSAGW